MSGLVNYPFPLRPDCKVQLYLPNPLTSADVERLRMFLATLVLEDPNTLTLDDGTVLQMREKS